MNIDYSTTENIRRTFNLPIPETCIWETTCEKIGVPFALMSFAEGTAISERWADENWITEDKRLKILTNLVPLMAKLQQPRFDDKGNISHVGPTYIVRENDEEYIEHGIIHVDPHGPYDSVNEWLSDDWDQLEGLPDATMWQKGCLEIVRLAILSIPPFFKRPGRFEIDVRDYNDQNILIDDDCNITAILDWDGVRTVPQGMGCTRYPAWITIDWDPGHYGNVKDEDWDLEGLDTPEELTKYRKHYADAFAALNLKDYDPRETRLSHILEAIKIASGDWLLRQFIVMKLLDHAFGEKCPWEFGELVNALRDPLTPESKIIQGRILEQFRGMWHAEWEEKQVTVRQGAGPKDRKRLRNRLAKFWALKRRHVLSLVGR